MDYYPYLYNMNRIRLWWKFSGRYYHKDIIQGIKNLIKWFPVIWKDRDFDHSKIFDVIKFKLDKQAKYIDKHDRHTRAQRDAEIMMTCVRLINLIQEEYYNMEYMDYHQTVHNWIPYKDKDEDGGNLMELQTEEISERFSDYFKKYPLQYKRALNPNTHWYYTEKNKQTIAMWIGNENQRRAQTLLFKILNDNIQKWWD